MKKIFGGSESQQQSSNLTGYGALPGFAQTGYRDLLAAAQPLINDPSQFFAPQGINERETQALDLIQSYQDPQKFQANIETFLNPYRGIISQDINEQFRAPQSALASRASEAGAFGGSRMRQGQADLEGERLNALTRALSGQYNTALGQVQQTIGNLLGFGGLERGVDLAQRQALPQGLSTFSNLISPLLRSGEGTSSGTSEDFGKGIFGSLFPGGL